MSPSDRILIINTINTLIRQAFECGSLAQCLADQHSFNLSVPPLPLPSFPADAPPSHPAHKALTHCGIYEHRDLLFKLISLSPSPSNPSTPTDPALTEPAEPFDGCSGD